MFGFLPIVYTSACHHSSGNLYVMKVLIVDDNTGVRQIIRAIIGTLADDVCECADGANAVSAYTCFHPDWVLMDIEMPVLDGLTATREILSAFPKANILIVSNHGTQQMREAASQAGARGFVVKENLLLIRSFLSPDLPH
jgi:CheY-like chemotaxis protein